MATHVAELDNHREKVYSELLKLYDDGSDYGGLSQLDHALQSAHQAVAAGADTATIVAALLHDVGWKLADSNPVAIDVAGAFDGESANSDAWKDLDHAGTCAPAVGCWAAELGILSTCGMTEGTSSEQARAQHDVIGATFLRMRGFDEKVSARLWVRVVPGASDFVQPDSVMFWKAR